MLARSRHRINYVLYSRQKLTVVVVSEVQPISGEFERLTLDPLNRRKRRSVICDDDDDDDGNQIDNPNAPPAKKNYPGWTLSSKSPKILLKYSLGRLGSS